MLLGQGVVQPWAMTTPTAGFEPLSSSDSGLSQDENSHLNSVNTIKPGVVGADDSNQN